MESRWKRRPPRLKSWNYASEGAYLVTFVVKDRTLCLSTVEDGKLRLTGIGTIVEQSWKELVEQFSTLTLDEMILMSDHVHAIFILQDDEVVSGPLMNQWSTNQATAGRASTPHARPAEIATQGSEAWILMKNPESVLGKIVRAWKARSTRLIRQSIDATFAWQARYYEHVIRGEEKLNKVRQYLIDNPARWEENQGEILQ